MINSITAGSANVNPMLNASNVGVIASQTSVPVQHVNASQEQQSDSNGYDERKAEVQKKAYEIARRVSQNGIGVNSKINSMKAKITHLSSQTRQYKAKAAAEHANRQRPDWADAQQQISKLVSNNAMTPEDIKGGMVDMVL